MMTREQWENAARFAGIQIQFDVADAPYTACTQRSGKTRAWKPDSDWDHFGPLWMKLNHWIFYKPYDGDIAKLVKSFKRASEENNQTELMHAGLLLAAAIGETMK